MMKQKSKKGLRKGSKIPRGSEFPPDFTPTRVLRCRYRFKATAASSGDQLTSDSWVNLLTFATGTTAGYAIGNYFRIRSIEMWGPMASDLVPVTVSCEWNGANVGLYGKSVIHSDTSMGSNVPAHVRSCPPLGSTLAQWQSNSQASYNLCKIAYPANAVVDVVYDLVLHDDGVAPTAQVLAAATTGALYVRALNSPVNNNLVPLSVSTI